MSAFWLAVFALSPHAQAIPFGGTGTLGSFTGEATYTSGSADTGTLVITLTNTSPLANGGFLTAFLFNNPSDSITGVTFSSTDADFQLLGLSDSGESGAPNGQFDVGSSTGGGFQGGGQPSEGIAVNASATFTFGFSGTGVGSLALADFFNEQSTGEGSGEGYAAFVARFRGFNDGGSDKVTGVVPPDDDPPPPPPPNTGNNPNVPEPATAIMLVLAGCTLTRRRRS